MSGQDNIPGLRIELGQKRKNQRVGWSLVEKILLVGSLLEDRAVQGIGIRSERREVVFFSAREVRYQFLNRLLDVEGIVGGLLDTPKITQMCQRRDQMGFCSAGDLGMRAEDAGQESRH